MIFGEQGGVAADLDRRRPSGPSRRAWRGRAWSFSRRASYRPCRVYGRAGRADAPLALAVPARRRNACAMSDIRIIRTAAALIDDGLGRTRPVRDADAGWVMQARGAMAAARSARAELGRPRVAHRPAPGLETGEAVRADRATPLAPLTSDHAPSLFSALASHA